MPTTGSKRSGSPASTAPAESRPANALAERIRVLGVGVSVLNLGQATRAVLQAVREGRQGYICITGVHGVIEAQDDESFHRVLENASLCTPDGVPLVWIGRHYYGKRDMGRVYGPDLMREVFRATEGTGIRHFFFGGNEGVADRLRDSLLERFPASEIVGTYCPPFRPLNEAEEKELLAELAATSPDIVWVGLSTPKQEKFMAQYLGRIPAGLMIGVGAAFDFHAGLVPQAPGWIQGLGMEWCFRLVKEPRRLWPRYSRIVPRFLYLYARQFLAEARAPRTP